MTQKLNGVKGFQETCNVRSMRFELQNFKRGRNQIAWCVRHFPSSAHEFGFRILHVEKNLLVHLVVFTGNTSVRVKSMNCYVIFTWTFRVQRVRVISLKTLMLQTHFSCRLQQHHWLIFSFYRRGFEDFYWREVTHSSIIAFPFDLFPFILTCMKKVLNKNEYYFLAI